MLKTILVGSTVLLVWNWAFESFVVKGPDGRGFIEAAPGMGLDDIVRALGGGASLYLAKRML